MLALWREQMYPALEAHGGDHKGEERKQDQPCGTRLIWGTSAYWQARIARDCPEEMAAIKAGGLVAWM